jgi:hypothetical protein
MVGQVVVSGATETPIMRRPHRGDRTTGTRFDRYAELASSSLGEGPLGPLDVFVWRLTRLGFWTAPYWRISPAV